MVQFPLILGTAATAACASCTLVACAATIAAAATMQVPHMLVAVPDATPKETPWGDTILGPYLNLQPGLVPH